MSKNVNFSFNQPDEWRIIKPAFYRNFSILSTEVIPCLYGFAIPRLTSGYDVVSVFDYGPWEDSFLEELKESIARLEANPENTSSINEYIAENADGYDVTSTNYIKPLFHKSNTFYDMPCYINIMKIISNVGLSYSIQAFFNIAGHCLFFGTAVPKIDEKDPFNSAIEKYDYIYDMFYKLIASFKITNVED